MELFSELIADARQGRSVYIATLIGTPPDAQTDWGGSLLVYPDGSLKGRIVNEEISLRVRDFLLAMQPASPMKFDVEGLPGLAFFCDTLELPQRAVVFGGGHISQPLVEFLSMIGYEVSVVDDRPDFANAARFPGAKQVLCCAFEDSYEQLSIHRTTAVVIVTRGHRHDLECLRQVLGSEAFYIGMIGSRHKVATVFEALRQEGVGADALRKIHAPIGLDINGKTPPEIALSIAAEILSVAKGGSCQPLSNLRGGMVR